MGFMYKTPKITAKVDMKSETRVRGKARAPGVIVTGHPAAGPHAPASALIPYPPIPTSSTATTPPSADLQVLAPAVQSFGGSGNDRTAGPYTFQLTWSTFCGMSWLVS